MVFLRKLIAALPLFLSLLSFISTVSAQICCCSPCTYSSSATNGVSATDEERTSVDEKAEETQSPSAHLRGLNSGRSLRSDNVFYGKDSEEEILTYILERIESAKSNLFPTIKKQDINVLSVSPLVFTIDNMFDEQDCDYIVESAKKQGFEESVVSSDKKGVKNTKVRTSTGTFMDVNIDKIFKKTADKISHLLNTPLTHAEPMQVIQYQNKQFYNAHTDSYSKTCVNYKSDLYQEATDIPADWSHRARRCMFGDASCKKRRWGGNRVFTALGYLNNVEKGGWTAFTNIDGTHGEEITVEPKKGRLLIFTNVIGPLNDKDLMSEHKGSPVLEGEKFAFNLWFREMPNNFD